MTEPLRIEYFSDIMCVWAYAGQIRLDELSHQFGARIHVEYRFMNIYGDVPRRIQEHCGGEAEPQLAYARKMRAVAARFEHTNMHDDAFAKVVPKTANQAHMVLAAVRLLRQPLQVDNERLGR